MAFIVTKVGKRRLSSLYVERFGSLLYSLFLQYIEQIDSMLTYVCSVIDQRRRQNVERTSVTRSAIASCAILVLTIF